MGKEKKVSDLKNWLPVQGSNLENGLVRESTTGREGERRTFIVDPFYDPKNEEYIYKYRRDTKAPLVAAYGSEVLKNKADKNHPVDKNDKKAVKAEKQRKKNVYMTAITEHIPHKLSEAPQLTFGESLYTLDRALEGYETAYDKCGPMWVNDKMIGYTPEGYAKVWVNDDFANNHPAFPRKVLESTIYDGSEFLEGRTKLDRVGKDEADFVENVVDVVADHCEQGRYPEPFRSQIHQKDLSFYQARKLVREYATSNNVFVPDRVDLWRNRCWGWRNTTHTKTYVPPPTQHVRHEPVHGYRFNYLPPDEPYHPDIFASRIGEHGVHHGHRY